MKGVRNDMLSHFEQGETHLPLTVVFMMSRKV